MNESKTAFQEMLHKICKNCMCHEVIGMICVININTEGLCGIVFESNWLLYLIRIG